jgi:hypothetical protein
MIDYHEILDELTADVIEVIEDCDHLSVQEKLIELTHQHNAKHSQLHKSLMESSSTAEVVSRRLAELQMHSQSYGQQSQSQSQVEEAIPPGLMGYLQDTFADMDLNKSGTLSPSELQTMLHTVLASSEGDREILQVRSCHGMATHRTPHKLLKRRCGVVCILHSYYNLMRCVLC